MPKRDQNDSRAVPSQDSKISGLNSTVELFRDGRSDQVAGAGEEAERKFRDALKKLVSAMEWAQVASDQTLTKSLSGLEPAEHQGSLR